PLTAHPNPVQAAQDEEDGEVRREAAGESDAREKQHVADQRSTASVAVGEQAKDDRPDGTKRQCGGRRPDDVALRNMEMSGEGVVQEDDDEEVESVHRPAEISGGDGMPFSAYIGSRHVRRL